MKGGIVRYPMNDFMFSKLTGQKMQDNPICQIITRTQREALSGVITTDLKE